MSYQKYGIDPAFVERVKLKMKNPETKERVKMILKDVTKYDLQDRVKVKRFVDMLAKVLGERLSPQQTENMVSYVISQKIDPSNTFHLIKLWSMFR
ncbi:stage VI sporulation protein F [Paenibacillus hamazuiensis]|uniref:stage VI sporulation protein F n=1 Tax=Paenibacillus hamazuiensis TaxID=2936508 RepID=UPI00200C1186|nr:stage VI sporulation protein F [Paenibacillus hamazuiensis]